MMVGNEVTKDMLLRPPGSDDLRLNTNTYINTDFNS